MRLILVRHGESFGNSNKIFEGRSGSQLTPKGFRQSNRLAKRLKGENIDKIFVSDLLHAIETSRVIINHHPKARVFYEKAIREQDFGNFAGKPEGSIKTEAEKTGIPFAEFVPPEGESFNQTKKRVWEFLSRLVKSNNGETVLFVTHGGIILTIILEILNKPFEDYEQYAPPNTAVTIIDIEDDGTKNIRILNCIKHLKEALF